MSRLLHLGSAGLAFLILWALVASGVFPRYSVTQVSADSLLVQYGSPGWLLAVAWIYLLGAIVGIATALFRAHSTAAIRRVVALSAISILVIGLVRFVPGPRSMVVTASGFTVATPYARDSYALDPSDPVVVSKVDTGWTTGSRSSTRKGRSVYVQELVLRGNGSNATLRSVLTEGAGDRLTAWVFFPRFTCGELLSVARLAEPRTFSDLECKDDDFTDPIQDFWSVVEAGDAAEVRQAVASSPELAQRALHSAASVGRARELRTLLQAGAPVDARDKAGRTALRLVPDSVTALLLCSRGADPAAGGAGDDTAHAQAAEAGRARLAEVLSPGGLCAQLSARARSAPVPESDLQRLVEEEQCHSGTGNCGRLGEAYQKGKGVSVDLAKAAFFYDKDCAKGGIFSCTRLASMYESGQGVGRDPARASRLHRLSFDHYRQACDQGTSWACSEAGQMYEQGKGVAVDLARAAALLEKACSGGWGHGCARLGWLYATGKGVRQDRDRSARLYRQACDLEYAWACERLAKTGAGK